LALRFALRLALRLAPPIPEGIRDVDSDDDDSGAIGEVSFFDAADPIFILNLKLKYYIINKYYILNYFIIIKIKK
jgi:hypothetical protein